MSRGLRALPAIVRAGVLESIVHRFEFLMFLVSTVQPMIMLGLWSFVAQRGAFHGYSASAFTAYFLAVVIVRNLTGNWVAWHIMQDLREGTLSMRLLRPMHPFVGYLGYHVSAVPMRALISVPIALVLLATSGGSIVMAEPIRLVAFVPSVALAWLIMFSVLFAVGALSFFIEQAMALTTFYFSLFQLFSGFLLPLELLPHPIAAAADWLPFKYMLDVPIEMLTRPLSVHRIGELLAAQTAWAAIALALALGVWRLGIRRYEAVGG